MAKLLLARFEESFRPFSKKIDRIDEEEGEQRVFNAEEELQASDNAKAPRDWNSIFPIPKSQNPNEMDPSSLEDSISWDFLDYSFISGNPSPEFCLPDHSASVEIDFSSGREGDCGQRDCSRKRGRNDSCSRPVSKACRERLRRERLNDRFLELSSVLDPGRTVKTDKHAILDDAIRILNQLRSESQELKETNEKLLGEIQSLKAEKDELREEKLVLKADKERLEQQLKAVAIPPAGFIPGHPAGYHAGPNKMAVFSSYGFVPMWQYLPPAARDTSHDHELRPPAA